MLRNKQLRLDLLRYAPCGLPTPPPCLPIKPACRGARPQVAQHGLHVGRHHAPKSGCGTAEFKQLCTAGGGQDLTAGPWLGGGTQLVCNLSVRPHWPGTLQHGQSQSNQVPAQ